MRRAAAKQIAAAAPARHPGKPFADLLAGHAGAGLPAAIDKFPERKRARPDVRQQDCGMPHMLAGHPEDKIRAREIVTNDQPAAVPGDITATRGHDREDLRRRRLALGQHPRRGQHGRSTAGGQLSRQQSLGHDRPADVARAQPEYPGHRAIQSL